MYGKDPLTGRCAYKTPCGWCARQGKKCDLEIKKQKEKYGDLFEAPKENVYGK